MNYKYKKGVFMKVLSLIISLIVSNNVFSKDVHVRGYFKANGSYVEPYIRTSPDSTRSNNYGRPSSYSNFQEVNHPETRDFDQDGILNINDMDDNNNGIFDENESY